jgi:hypothetical protein
MRRLCVVALMLVGCSHDLGDPQARYLEPALAATPLTTAPGARLLPAVDGAALVSVTATEVRWALLAPDGHLGPEAVAPVPAHTVGPWVGLTAAATYGDRSVVVWGEPKGGDPAAGLRLAAQIAGNGGADTAIVELGEVAPALTASLRVSVATHPPSGGVAVAIGFEGQPGTPVSVRVVRPGAPTALGGDVPNLPSNWRCLSLVPSRSAFAVSAASADPADAASNRTPVDIAELNPDGREVFVHQLNIEVRSLGCPDVAATPTGYLLAFQKDAGLYLADYDIAAHASPTNFVLGSVRFGGPDDQPPLAAVLRLGRFDAALLARKSGPEVWSFDAQGRIHGAPLRLPVDAPLAPGAVVTGSSVAGELWVSYLDGAARRFLRIQSTASSADEPADGGARD